MKGDRENFFQFSSWYQADVIENTFHRQLKNATFRMYTFYFVCMNFKPSICNFC